MAIKINGVLAQNLQQKESQVQLYEPIEGTTYQNIVFRSHMTGSFSVTPEMVAKRFIRVACSCMLTLPLEHAFLDQEDSDSIRIRVVHETKPLITRQEHRESREFMIFYSFFAVTGTLLLINHLFQRMWQQQEAKHIRMADMDANSFIVCAAYANPNSSVHRVSLSAEGQAESDNNNEAKGEEERKESKLL